jgi:hypothetical protein
MRLGVLLALGVPSACALALSAGHVDSLGGKVNVARPAGELALRPGSEIQEGDTLVTGGDGWALLSMTDGGIITLRPDTRLRIDTYRYSAGARQDDNVLLNLLRGAFRSVTGEVGHFSRDNYKIRTPTATIGIRGTDHEPAHYPPGESGDHEPGTFDRVVEGESFIENAQGRVPVRAGQFAFVKNDGRTAPRLLDRAPAFYERHAQLDQRLEARHRALREIRLQRIERRLERRERDSRRPEAHLAPRHGVHQPGHSLEARGVAAHANAAPTSREERAEERRFKGERWQGSHRDGEHSPQPRGGMHRNTR